jgi:hypothetical protein
VREHDFRFIQEACAFVWPNVQKVTGTSAIGVVMQIGTWQDKMTTNNIIGNDSFMITQLIKMLPSID